MPLYIACLIDYIYICIKYFITFQMGLNGLPKLCDIERFGFAMYRSDTYRCIQNTCVQYVYNGMD